MLSAIRRALVPVVIVAGWLLAGGPAAALTPTVKDEASFFSPKAIQQANDGIRDIKDRFHKDLVVETFKTVPANKVDQVAKMDGQARNQFFEEWVRDRARQEGVDGIFVLICQKP